jgi:uncharacterized membrane protein
LRFSENLQANPPSNSPLLNEGTKGLAGAERDRRAPAPAYLSAESNDSDGKREIIMKTRQSSTCWLGLALACGTLTFAVTTQAGKPVKPPPPPPTPAYVPVLLGGLQPSDGLISTGITDLNNAGQVVGSTCLPGYDSGHHGQAFLLNPRDNDADGKPDTWFADEVQNATGVPGADGQNDLIIGLGYIPGYASSGATAVNDLGFVVGSSGTTGFVVVPEDTNGDGRADLWCQDVSPQDGFNDLMVSLGSEYAPEDINNLGWIVGTCRGNGFLLIPAVDAAAMEWFRNDGSGGNMLATDLGAFIPSNINDSGQIVGTVAGRAVLRNPDGTQIDLGAAGIDSRGVALNNCGQVGIWFRFSLELCREGHAGLLTPLDANNDGITDTWYQDQNADGVNDLIVDLGVVERMLSTGIPKHAVNDAGAVAGVSCNYRSGYHRAPFLWQAGMLQTLKELTGGTMEFWDVGAINNAGQIACQSNSGGACILLPAAE